MIKFLLCTLHSTQSFRMPVMQTIPPDKPHFYQFLIFGQKNLANFNA